ncbi:DUF4926 domain-containing protein [Enterovirga sp. CN4-39]|uniref:DUF4926 domain-containing protein n=1 Tax=Enterovirga sp. CN4-39 TaxID=3400910 RepID=UPI003C01E9DE
MTIASAAPASKLLAEHDPAELDVVSLLEPVVTETGTLPRGAQGTIVMKWQGDPAYCVEFIEPFPSLVDLTRSQFEVVWTA